MELGRRTLKKTSTNRKDVKRNDLALTKRKAGEEKNGYRSRADALILIDWDDTLFPTHYIGWIESQPGGKDATFATQKAGSVRHQLLSDVKNAALALLRRSSLLGTVAVVTNSQQGWVADSARRWAPDMMPFLRRMPVVSARSMFEGREAEAFRGFASSMPRSLLENPKRAAGRNKKSEGKIALSKTLTVTTPKTKTATEQLQLAARSSTSRTGRKGGNTVSEAAQVNWKTLAFLVLVFRKQAARIASSQQVAMQTGVFIPPSPLIVVSIGDSRVEREAIRRLDALGLPNVSPVRSVKLCNDPAPKDLTAQLIQITNALPNIIFRPTAIDIWLCPKPS
jgi:hypothetical protein